MACHCWIAPKRNLWSREYQQCALGHIQIDMSFNAIEEVTNDMLVMSSNLRYIDLYNYLKYFRAGQFDNLIHVKGVRLIARTQGVDANNIPFRSPITVVEAPIIDGPQHLIQLPQDSPVAERQFAVPTTRLEHIRLQRLGNTEAERAASKQCWLKALQHERMRLSGS